MGTPETGGDKEPKPKREIKGPHQFWFEYGEPDEQGIAFIDKVRERGREFAALNVPSPFLQAIVEVGTNILASGYQVGSSNFIDGVFVFTDDVRGLEHGDAIIAMMVESVSGPPREESAA
ncbi:MAG TPA: hypothetical protein VLF90_02470 [Patescibacteria group bacterium]|nr:hypothetical protein [Patescibacteria group bacterium]